MKSRKMKTNGGERLNEIARAGAESCYAPQQGLTEEEKWTYGFTGWQQD
jgi:hypothetical protein